MAEILLEIVLGALSAALAALLVSALQRAGKRVLARNRCSTRRAATDTGAFAPSVCRTGAGLLGHVDGPPQAVRSYLLPASGLCGYPPPAAFSAAGSPPGPRST